MERCTACQQSGEFARTPPCCLCPNDSALAQGIQFRPPASGLRAPRSWGGGAFLHILKLIPEPSHALSRRGRPVIWSTKRVRRMSGACSVVSRPRQEHVSQYIYRIDTRTRRACITKSRFTTCTTGVLRPLPSLFRARAANPPRCCCKLHL